MNPSAPLDGPSKSGRDRPDATPEPEFDRSLGARIWYVLVRYFALCLFGTFGGGLRAGGRQNIPARGAALLVSNHASYLDSFVVGIPCQRPLNFVARSTLFFSIVGLFIKSLGGFPIQREGMGAAGLKETLKRLRRGGIVILFPEGTRTRDGKIAPLKSGIAVMAARAKVPIIPAAVAGTFEAFPRSVLFPRPHPMRVEFGPPIFPADIVGMSSEAVTALIAERVHACHCEALRGLARDLDHGSNQRPISSSVGDQP